MKKLFYMITIFTSFTALLYLLNQPPTPKHISLLQKIHPKGPNPYPAQWQWLKRTFPYGKADENSRRLAFRQKQQMLGLSKKGTLNWEFAGPTNVSGRVVDVEFDPQNPNIVYAGAATGGVFKSFDAGKTWMPIFDDQLILSVGDIAVDPVNSNIVYVGTGEANGGHNNFPGGGLYKSTDGGVTWRFKGLDNTTSIGRIVINPLNTSKVYVAAVGSYFAPTPERGVYLSKNGGNSWEKSLFINDSTGAIDLIIDPDNPDFLMAAVWERVRPPVWESATHLYGKSSGVYRTMNGGTDWELLNENNGLPNASKESIGRIGLTISGGVDKKIYALYNDGTELIGIYLSENRGENWRKCTDASKLSSGTRGFSWYFGQIRCAPHNPEKIWVLDVWLMRSDNAGESFGAMTSGTHVDYHAMAFKPDNPNYIICGNDGGIAISEDGGLRWRRGGDMPITQFYELGLDSSFSNRLYGGTQDNGTYGTQTGNLDDWKHFLGGDGFYTLVQPNNPDMIYAEYQWGNLFRINAVTGERKDLLNQAMRDEPRNWSTPVVMDPRRQHVLYYGSHRLWKSDNDGDSWSKFSPILTKQLEDSRVGTITTIAVAPSNSDVVYTGSDDGSVWVTEDGGNNWSHITGNLPFRWVTRIKVHPKDHKIAYITFSGLRWKDPQPHIFRTDNAGLTWENVNSNLPDSPINALAIDFVNPSIIYVGNEVGVFYSEDEGAFWKALGSNLPSVVINDMQIHHKSNELIVATHGRSMYKMNLSVINSIEKKERKNITFSLFQNYPNPFNPSTQISFSLTRPSFVKMEIFNALGERISTLIHKKMSAGNHKVQFDSNGLPSGVYFYRLTANDFVAAKKMLLMR
jgi:photosystem II stability/assembly factor-like uncharacterized protein